VTVILWHPSACLAYAMLTRHYHQAVREAATISPLQVDLWHSDFESGVRVTCEVGYLCANFSLPRPLCSRLRPDIRDRQTSDVRRQTDVRRASSLNAPYPRGGA